MKKKNKLIATLLWLTLGLFGGHRFYLGSIKVGILYIALLVMSVSLEDAGQNDLSDFAFGVLALLWIYDLFVVLRWKNNVEELHDVDNPPSVKAVVSAGTVEEVSMSSGSQGPVYPEDGITDVLDGLNSEVWDRGYYKATSGGTWYEVYVTDTIKGYFHDMSLDNEDWEQLRSFESMNLDHYQDDNQITFFVADEEDEFTLDELTEMLI